MAEKGSWSSHVRQLLPQISRFYETIKQIALQVALPNVKKYHFVISYQQFHDLCQYLWRLQRRFHICI